MWKTTITFKRGKRLVATIEGEEFQSGMPLDVVASLSEQTKQFLEATTGLEVEIEIEKV